MTDSWKDNVAPVELKTQAKNLKKEVIVEEENKLQKEIRKSTLEECKGRIMSFLIEYNKDFYFSNAGLQHTLERLFKELENK